MVSSSRDAVVCSDAPWPGSLSSFQRPRNYDGVDKVVVEVEGVLEEVMLDPERGPILIERDGSQVYGMLNYAQADFSGRHTTRIEKTWTYLTSTEQTVFLHMVAKKNKRTRELINQELPRSNIMPMRPAQAGRLRDFYKLLGRTDEPM